MSIAAEPFTEFWHVAEPRLRRALSVQFGAEAGQAAAVHALSWAWEHWPQVSAMSNPVGYLFRVGQTAARREQQRPIPAEFSVQLFDAPDVDLARGLQELSDQQRVAVVLVHAYGYTLRDAAQLLDISVATVRVHLSRGLARLRSILEEPT